MADNYTPVPEETAVYVLTVDRNGERLLTKVGALPDLMVAADSFDHGSLHWQDYTDHIGAGSTHDDERTYLIHKADS